MEAVSSVLVTVQGPDERVELQLPAHQPIAELLPLLVEVCGGPAVEGTQWEDGLLPQERTRLVLPPRVSVPDRLVHAAQAAIRPAGIRSHVPATQSQLG